MEKYKELLSNMKSETRGKNDHILLVDGLNTLMRAFSTVNTINPKGNHVGGISGFLKSMGSVVRQVNPTRIIVVWDGRGGSQNRKHINANYKAQREHASVIHYDVFDTKAEELESVWNQANRLKDYLECLPVTVIEINKLEADDVIAYLARCADYVGSKATILSTDKDFLQLVDDNIQVYSPPRKVQGKPVRPAVLDYKNATEFLGFIPENYNIVKALLGDSSDNLRGVRGLGTTTLLKIFPRIKDDPTCDLQYVYDTCAENIGKKKICATIIDDWKIVETNFQIMDLNKTVLDDAEKSLVAESIKLSVPRLNIGPFLHYLEQDCIEGITKNTEEWLSTFRYLQNFQ